MFDKFLSVFPPIAGETERVDADLFAATVSRKLKSDVPLALRGFWKKCGVGYFGDRDLYFFGPPTFAGPRDELVTWNKHKYWRDVLTKYPGKGGPVFFAETRFGNQLGYWYQGSDCCAVLVSAETLKTFLVAANFAKLFSEVLNTPDRCVEGVLLKALRKKRGPTPPGMHYAAKLHPQFGGHDKPANYELQPADEHIVISVAIICGAVTAEEVKARRRSK